MTRKLVFLLEEKSMQVLLEGLLPRLFPGLVFQCIPHEGKQDLEKSIPRKLRAWREPQVRFVIVRDNDNGDCAATKARLVALCRDAGRPDALVRIICQELEAWYFGNCEALAVAFDDVSLLALAAKQRFRDPDAIVRPSGALSEFIEAFQKVSGARVMSQHLTRESRSRSFQVFVDGLERLLV